MSELVKRRWRLLAGMHNEDGVTYRKDDIVETSRDLSVFGDDKFALVVETVDPNSEEALMAEKNRIEELLAKLKARQTPAVDATSIMPPEAEVDDEDDDGLNAMTVDELKKHAEAENIPLNKARTKTEIIQAIRFALQ